MAEPTSKKPPSPVSVTVTSVEAAPVHLDVEKLGRERPAVFPSALAEVAFCFSVIQSAFMSDYLISGFQTILPALSLSLDIPPESRTWPSSVLALVAGALLLPIGRLADMYGSYVVFNVGFAWFTIWSLAAGFSNNAITLIVCRAMEGLGAACILPCGISLLGTVYRPGPRKNFVFAMYGAMCPVGFFLGMFVGGLSEHLLTWRWYFWLGAMVSALSCITALVSIPIDFAEARARNLHMDWWGVFTSVPGLLLVVYAVTDSTSVAGGWANPQIWATFAAGVAFLLAAVYVEGWVATMPLVPGDIFKVRHMNRMLLGLFITYGVFGIYLFYANFYLELILGLSPLTTSLWFAPWAAGGLMLAATSGFIMHLIPGKILLVICGVCKIVAVLLFALMPPNPNLWAWVFPAMVAETACVDILYTVSNVFITTNLPSHRQGMGGALISCTVFFGLAIFLGIANLSVSSSAHLGEAGSYKVAFWIGVAFAALGLLIFLSLDLREAKGDLTVDEKMEMREAAEADN